MNPLVKPPEMVSCAEPTAETVPTANSAVYLYARSAKRNHLQNRIGTCIAAVEVCQNHRVSARISKLRVASGVKAVSRAREIRAVETPLV